MPQNQPAPFTTNYLHITGAGTVVAKGSTGILSSLNINSASSAATVTLVDNNTTITGGTTIGVITLGAAVTVPTRIPYGSDSSAGDQFNLGLVIITSGTLDLTVSYK